MDYCMDANDGVVSMWTGTPNIDIDGDGTLDGLRLDIDGDGVFDDAIGDGDIDGLGDYVLLDLDDDGTPEARFTDDGTGTWAVSGSATRPAVSGSATRPLNWLGLDGTEHSGPGDIDGDGIVDRFVDVDRDGLADRALRVESDGLVRTGYVDTDGDGYWDIELADSDADGAADAATRLPAWTGRPGEGLGDR